MTTEQRPALVHNPLGIGGVRIPNRVARTAHFTGYAFGAPNEVGTDYHLARGGVGLTFLEAAAVHPSSILGLTAFDDGVIAATSELMARIEPTGMKVFQQFFHGGNHYAPPGGLPTQGCDRVPERGRRLPRRALLHR